MTTISNPTADKEEKIAHAAKLLRSSPQARKVFEVVYKGKKHSKTIKEIQNSIKGFNINTYNAAAKLAAEDIIDKKTINKCLHYSKKDFYIHNKKIIINLSKNNGRLKNYTTKRNPKITGYQSRSTIIKLFTKPQVSQIYIDDIDSFNKIKKSSSKEYNLSKISERIINEGLCRILNQDDKKDWGGEKNDLFTNNITFNKKRKSACLILKGKATKGTLTPNKLGKNGDQVQRLFEVIADIYILVYHSDVSESIIDLMQTMAIAKSLRENKKIYYCIIDGRDLNRLVDSYKEKFNF